MGHKNSSKQFLKVPTDFSHLNRRGELVGISFDKRNLYLAYLFVKSHSRFGRVHKSKLPKRHFWHWIDKLTSSGLMSVNGEYYSVKSYEAVWGLLGIQKFKCNRKLRYTFYKVKSYPSWSEFKKKTNFEIQASQTERKLSQMRHRTANYEGNKTSSLSAQAVANLFGYKSAFTGSKYRDKFFDVVEEPLRMRLKYTSDLLPYFKFDCKKVYLKPIFHGC